ncbi:hypothetical protein V1514DRAFT_337986 [Lipomyces japonicus]|uniref:uncharacterized protein n=1 Tax=Lipomyces japonicus TaxID=56871 RepID=UPI0034CE1AC7
MATKRPRVSISQSSGSPAKDSPSPKRVGMLSSIDPIAVTTRQTSACPACRKQKTKCIMENGVPPCKRCSSRGLLCYSNKSVLNLMQEQVKWNSHMKRNFSRLQAAVNESRAALSLPPILVMDEIETVEDEARLRESDILSDDGLDHGDGAAFGADSFADAPLRSLYEATRVSPHDKHGIRQDTELQSRGLVLDNDFISRGVITLAEAEQLSKVYLGKLDHFFYEHLQNYPDFASIRKVSTLLALTACTVASLHDPLGSELYDILSKELRNLTSSLMFRPRLGIEDIKAMCMANYWIADMTWMISSLADRKAVSMHYHTQHLDQPNTDREGFNQSQLWLLIYLSNEQISILQGVPPSGVGRAFVNWENHLASSFAGETDLRLATHIDMLLILSRFREVCGLGNRKLVDEKVFPVLREFLSKLDEWGNKWSGKLAKNRHIGEFPSEAVQIHWRFSKFYIATFAFRGLTVNFNTILSNETRDIVNLAIDAAYSILDLLLNSNALQTHLVGMPHYFHIMFAFAAVFLLKIATRYGKHIVIDVERVFNSIQQVLEVFAQCPCARQHLVHRITKGLTQMLKVSKIQINQDHIAQDGNNQQIEINDFNATAPSMQSINVEITRDDNHLEDVINNIFDESSTINFQDFNSLSTLPPSWLSDFYM